MSSSTSSSSDDKSVVDKTLELPLKFRNDIISQIYESKSNRNVFSLCITGGGAYIIPWLLSVPGSSTSFMNTNVPYSRHALYEYMEPSIIANNNIHTNDQKFQNKEYVSNSMSIMPCNEETSIKMAKQAYNNAIRNLLHENHNFHDLQHTNIFGIACTAALVSKTIKKGYHRCHIATYNSLGNITTYTYYLEKGYRTRNEEDKLCSNLILHSIFEKCHITSPFTFNMKSINYLLLTKSQSTTITTSGSSNSVAANNMNDNNNIQETEVLMQQQYNSVTTMLDKLYNNETEQVLFIPFTPTTSSTSNPPRITTTTTTTATLNSTTHTNSTININHDFISFMDLPLPRDSIIYPGSFNPLHEGHVALVAAALRSEYNHTQSNSQSQSQSSGSTSTADSNNNNNTNSTTWKTAQSNAQRLVIFEIAAINADKPPISQDIIIDRLQQFHPRNTLGQMLQNAGITNYAICITSKPLFLQKSDCFKNCVFVIGADTFARLIDSKYYYTPPSPSSTSSSSLPLSSSSLPLSSTTKTTTSGSTTATINIDENIKQQQQQQQQIISLLNMVSALTCIMNNGCRFIVGGRKRSTSIPTTTTTSATTNAVSNNKQQQQQHDFDTLNDLLRIQNLPVKVAEMFIGLTEDEFRVDLSSTEIRQRNK